MLTGVFGGSFDPVHIGHYHMVEYLVERRVFDRLLLLVSPLNPLKVKAPPMFTDAERLAMTREAMSRFSEVEVSDFERTLPIPSYTYRTLTALAEAYPGRRFRLITGADNLRDFRKWRNPGEILREFGLTVYPRPGVEIESGFITALEEEYGAPGSVSYLADAPLSDVSSTRIRAMLSRGENPAPLLPPGVSLS